VVELARQLQHHHRPGCRRQQARPRGQGLTSLGKN
jgi:hypothetical protein